MNTNVRHQWVRYDTLLAHSPFLIWSRQGKASKRCAVLSTLSRCYPLGDNIKSESIQLVAMTLVFLESESKDSSV
jgi:hypothetical protein